MKTQRRVSAYYGFFKAASIKSFKTVREHGSEKGTVISIAAIQNKASIITAREARRTLSCAA